MEAEAEILQHAYFHMREAHLTVQIVKYKLYIFPFIYFLSLPVFYLNTNKPICYSVHLVFGLHI